MTEYRTYKIERSTDARFYRLIPSKGRLPEKLSGLYTSEREAKNRIDAYIGIPNGSETRAEN